MKHPILPASLSAIGHSFLKCALAVCMCVSILKYSNNILSVNYTTKYYLLLFFPLSFYCGTSTYKYIPLNICPLSTTGRITVTLDAFSVLTWTECDRAHIGSMVRTLLLLSTAGALRSLTCVTFLSLAPFWMSANRAFLPPPPPPDWSLGGSDGHCHTEKKKSFSITLTSVLPCTGMCPVLRVHFSVFFFVVVVFLF